MGLFDQRVRVAHESVEETRDSLGEHHRRDLAAVEHVVADGKLKDLDAGCAVVLRDPRIDAFVATAGDDDLVGSRQVFHDGLRERRP